MKNLKITLLLSSMAMIGPLAIDSYFPSFHAIGREFNVSQAQVQQTLSIYMLTFSITTLFIGALSDAVGRKIVILVSMCLFGIVSAFIAFAQTFESLVILRGFQGASSAAGLALGHAIVRDKFEGVEAQKLIATTTMIFGIAPALAPMIGGFLEVHFGWRSNFHMMTIYAILIAAAVYLYFDETHPPHLRNRFVPRVLLANYIRTFSNVKFMGRVFILSLAFGGTALYISSAASFVIEILKLDEQSFHVLFFPIVGGMIMGAFIGSKLAEKIERKYLVRIGLVIAGIGVISNLLFNAYNAPILPWVVLPIACYTLGMSILSPAIVVGALNLVPENRGLGSSLINFVRMMIFAGTASLIAPIVFDSAFKLAIAMAIYFALAIILWAILYLSENNFAKNVK